MKWGIGTLAFSLIVAAPLAAGAQWECADSVLAYVDGSRVGVVHIGALYNCCVSGFDYDVTVEPGNIVVVENEILTNPCYCLCCMDAATSIEDVPAGEYVLAFWWLDYEEDAWRVWILDIVVQDVGQFGDPHVAWAHHSDCYGSTTDTPRDLPPATWGAIKNLYR